MPTRFEHRLARLEQVEPAGRIDLIVEWKRWEAVLARVAAAIGTDPADKLPAELAHYVRLSWSLLVAADGLGDWSITLDSLRRRPNALLALVERLNDPTFTRDLLSRTWAKDPGGWRWNFYVDALAAGTYRLPPDATPKVVRATIDILAADSPPNTYFTLQACDACGLGVPFPNPRRLVPECHGDVLHFARPIYAACPSCGGKDLTHTHMLSRSSPKPWMELAGSELDPDR